MEITEIREKLIEILCRVLAEDSASFKVDTSKSLIEDFGLDSLDLLDFAFNIEVDFDVKIGPNELSLRAKDRIDQSNILDEDGFLTELALDELRSSVPEIPAHMFRSGLRQTDIPRLLNIDVFARLVHDKLGEK